MQASLCVCFRIFGHLFVVIKPHLFVFSSNRLRVPSLDGHSPIDDESEAHHYDSTLQLMPATLPPGLAGSLHASTERPPRLSRKRPLPDASPSPQRSGGVATGTPGVSRSVTLDDELDADAEEGAEGEGAVAVAYGEGLAVLLSHLATSRRPRVQAWLQLKEDLIRSDAAALGATQGWEDINDLEADFIVTNAQHLQQKSWLVA